MSITCIRILMCSTGANTLALATPASAPLKNTNPYPNFPSLSLYPYKNFFFFIF